MIPTLEIPVRKKANYFKQSVVYIIFSDMIYKSRTAGETLFLDCEIQRGMGQIPCCVHNFDSTVLLVENER